MREPDNFKFLHLWLLVLALGVSQTACTTQRAADILGSCKGGEVVMRFASGAGSNGTTTEYATAKVVSSYAPGLGLNIVTSLCPIPLASDRTLTINLPELPTAGKSYTLGSAAAGATAPSLDYSEYAMDLQNGTRTSRTWSGSGVIRVTSVSGRTVTLSGNGLTLSPQSGSASGSLSVTELRMRIDEVPGL